MVGKGTDEEGPDFRLLLILFRFVGPVSSPNP